MNRTLYFNYIEEKLSTLACRIDSRGKLNILDLHVHSENFYRDFFNKLFGWQLDNLNKKLQNVEAIDLVDHVNKLVIQVSATNTETKIESALAKGIIKKYHDYTFKFISISKDASNLRKKTYTNPHSINFIPLSDIFDTKSILDKIFSLTVNEQRNIYSFIREELGGDVDVVKLDSNLATIINILSKEDWDNQGQSISINSFEIDRKITYNNLNAARYIIDDYKIHYSRVDKKYTEFDASGVNKSSSVLAVIRKEYIENFDVKSADELFLIVRDNIYKKILESANYVPIPTEELELCVNILVVDAFIRCKIFEDPKNYNYAAT
ncbi:MAG: SMEK domain-containing protein [Candidatus Omnitrophica bacterium]|nr:SMEK domain-containing protein [Candidatus Omnitrophota bacterium]MBU1047049.1 SMEK domain-containing protein [Candidatus Omnitrophota bacterium]MBU1630970.1 SMEK domain-containing protein [Candidatus Omnitrophota bacterium]MBU1767046.1 SMEK domain-containing protein [Candidatus Omnitrophota bacterium]MBU1889281.1 SMEK domain-containing protein [Candidatus Omnitrophota bacterium]